jgi:hypothetical protein
VTYRSSSQLAGASAANAAVPVPAGAAIGDIAVVGIYLESAATITPPSGFTNKASLATSPTARGRLEVFWKRLTAADSGTWSFTFTSTFRAAAAGLWSGRVATGDPFDATPGTAESTSGVTTLNVSTSPVASLGDAVGFWTNFNGGGAFTAPGSYTERQEVSGVITLDTRDAVAAGSTGNVTATCTITDFMKAFLGVLAPASSGNNQAAGPALETDTGVAVTRTRSSSVSPAAETDTGVQPGNSTTVAPAPETDTGVAVTRTRTSVLAPGSETDTGVAVGRSRSQTAGPALEIDVGVAVSSGGGTPVTAATETDTGVAVGRTRAAVVGPAGETDTGQPVARTRASTTAPAGETDVGVAVGRTRTSVVAPAAELDTGQPVTRTRSSSVDPAIEIDTAVDVHNPNEALRDLLLAGEIEPGRWSTRVEPGRWTATLESNRWAGRVEA